MIARYTHLHMHTTPPHHTTPYTAKLSIYCSCIIFVSKYTCAVRTLVRLSKKELSGQCNFLKGAAAGRGIFVYWHEELRRGRSYRAVCSGFARCAAVTEVRKRRSLRTPYMFGDSSLQRIGCIRGWESNGFAHARMVIVVYCEEE